MPVGGAGTAVVKERGMAVENNTSVWNDIEAELEKCEFPNEHDDVIVWGAGLMGQLEVPLLEETLHITAFCDNSKEKQRSGILGRPCIAPERIGAYNRPFVLVSTIKSYAEIGPQLNDMGIRHCTVDAYVIHQNAEKFYQVYRDLDESSRAIYAKVLRYRLTGDAGHIYTICSDGQYFALPQFRFCSSDEVFVDCGAFVGDVVEKFIENNLGVFKKIYAFEPNRPAFEAMKRRINGLHDIWLFRDDQILCEQKCVGKECGETPFYSNEQNAANCSIQENDDLQETVALISLDRYFADCGEPCFTFLKADIEGYEWDMLQGAREMIRRNRPKLAISIYHSIYDFFRIPIFLKELVPEYHFAVRHHWNSFDETILYCWI